VEFDSFHFSINVISDARVEFFTAVEIQDLFFWVVTPCRDVVGYY